MFNPLLEIIKNQLSSMGYPNEYQLKAVAKRKDGNLYEVELREYLGDIYVSGIVIKLKA